MATQSGGVRALLFERLSGCEPGSPPEARPFRVHDGEALRASVAREVGRLLNTRVPPPAPGPAGRTVVDYGLADWTPAHALDPGARAALEAEARRSIEAFEPRLRRVQVRAETVTGRERTLLIRIDAVLAVDGGEEPFSFPVRVGSED
jgi:type VI secretion system lysozyme-like protein